MEFIDYYPAVLGGLLIGTSACVLLLFTGRIAGLSGIINGVIIPAKSETGWRAVFIASLLAGAAAHYYFFSHPQFIEDSFSPVLMLAGGFLVGFGTNMGSGCTSGHGVCGLGRLSLRSLIATLTFMLTAVVTVFVFRQIFSLL
jgi:uncharacterized membrane protein YedE/YeeE